MSDLPQKSHKEHKKRSFASFWWHGFKKAFKKSWDKYNHALIIAGLVYEGAAFSLSKSLERKLWGVDMTVWLTLVVPSVILGLFLLYHFARAPYEIYLEHWNEAERERENHAKEIEEKDAKFQTVAAEIKSLQAVNKRRFLAFMAQLKGEATNTHADDWLQFYENKIPNIQYESTLIALDFQPEARASFEMEISIICDSTLAYDDRPSNRRWVLSQIDAISNWVKDLPNYG